MTQIAHFDIERLQFLADDGTLIHPDQAPAIARDFDTLRDYYKAMVLTRTFDQKIIALQRTGQMGTYPSVLGQEAIGTSIGYTLQPQDVFVPYYRDQATQWLRGVPMPDILRYWGGDERGNAFGGQAQQDFPCCVPIATQITHAAGIATAFKVRKEHRAVVVTCGEGATSRGDFYESLNLAGAWHLPLVIVVNNNQWAISVPREVQTAAQTIAQKAIAAGVHGLQVDGNDPLAMHEAMTQALDHAYHFKGCTLIEAVSYRLGDHTTADDATRYRSQEALNQAWQREPIKRLQTYLHANGQWDESQQQALQEACQQKVKQAVEEYLATPPEAPEAMFDYLYEELPPELLEQRQHLLDKLARQSTQH